MKLKLTDIDEAILKSLPPRTPDGSDAGINYADALIKKIQKLKITTEDGRKITCKRRGLRFTLNIGDKIGTGLLRRLENGPDIQTIVHEGISEAAKEAGLVLTREEGALFLEVSD